MNRERFYNHIRPLYGSLSQRQVDGIEAILNKAATIPELLPTELAYILATIHHETATTMQPIEEFGKGKGRDYGEKLKYGKGPGRRIPYRKPDQIYYGRGHTQNTWYEIYDKLTRAAMKEGHAWDFLNHPELLLQMEPSLWATFYAMRTGLYTGKKLSDYFSAKKTNYMGARRIINGQDKALLIAQYAEKFHQALMA